jgi:NodT family efflux transporter outer membrane factor (OMF) lipoprotein
MDSIMSNAPLKLGIAAALTSGFLSACAVGPDFQRPDAPSVDRYTNTAPTAVANVPAQEVRLGTAVPNEWWRMLHSARLDTTIEDAIAHNQTLEAARANVRQAQSLVAARTGLRYPEVDLTAGIGRQKIGAHFLGSFPPPPPFTYYAFGPAVSYTLDFFGGVSRSIEQQRALAEYQLRQAQAAQLTVSGNVVLQAIEIAAKRAEIATVEAIVNEDRRNVDMIQATFEAGTVGRVEVLSAQTQLTRDQALLPPLRQELAVARHALAVLVGKPPANSAADDFELASFQLPAELPVDVPSELVHRRPDILAAEAQLHAATAAVGIATANLYPQLTLTATFSQESLSTGTIFDSKSQAWTMISRLTAPIFDGGRLRNERQAAIEALAVQAARYRQTVLESFGQVANALDGIQHTAEALSAEAEALRVAEENVELARESFNEGYANALQVLDAERLYQQARLGHVRAQAQRLRNTAQLYIALGGS